MTGRIVLTVLLLVLASELLMAQKPSDLTRHKQELQSIRDQITSMENQITEQQKREKVSLDLLDTYDRKAGLVHRLINRLRSESQEMQLHIDSSRATVARLEDKYSYLKSQYAQYITSVYKAGPILDLELLFSSRSLNEFFIRNEYLKQFTAQRKRDADAIVERKQLLEEVQARLQVQLGDQQRMIEEKAGEEQRLASLATERRQMVSQIRKDRKLLQRSIERQVKAAKDLENMITQLIEAERIRKEKEEKEREAAAKKGVHFPQPSVTVGDFAARRGKLRWPVSEGLIVAHFGTQRHPTLKTITQNTGIDIAVKAGSPVNAIAEGEVATIWWLPSFGNLVIINHYSGYRTVYAHLADIKVVEGQHVKEGDIIAESGESVDGPRLHFEIWKDREKQNPENWLNRQ